MIKLIYLRKLWFFDLNLRRNQGFFGDKKTIIFFIFFDEVMGSMKVNFRSWYVDRFMRLIVIVYILKYLI